MHYLIRNTSFGLPALLLAGFLFAPHARAAAVEYTSLADLQAAYTGSMLTEDFEAALPRLDCGSSCIGQILFHQGDTQAPLNSDYDGSFGNYFQTGDIVPNVNFLMTDTPPGSAYGWYVVNNTATPGGTYLSSAGYGMEIYFDTPVTAVGFDLVPLFSSTIPTDVIVNGADGEIASYSSSGNDFVGVISDTPITSITFSNDFVDVDNVTFSDVADTPEPATLLTIPAGLLAVAAWRRRKIRLQSTNR